MCRSSQCILSFRQVAQRLPSTALPLALALPLMDTADWPPTCNTMAALCRLPWGWGSLGAHPVNEAAVGPLSSSVSTEWLLAPWIWACGLGHVVAACGARGLWLTLRHSACILWLSGAGEWDWGGPQCPSGSQSPAAMCCLFCTCDLWHKVSSEGAGALQTAFYIRDLG